MFYNEVPLSVGVAYNPPVAVFIISSSQSIHPRANGADEGLPRGFMVPRRLQPAQLYHSIVAPEHTGGVLGERSIQSMTMLRDLVQLEEAPIPLSQSFVLSSP